MLTKSKKDIAEDICRLLQSWGLNFVVAGGSARDTALGLEPKDYDIVVYDWGSDINEVADKLTSMHLRLSELVENSVMPYSFMPSYHDAAEGGDFGSRLYGVYKLGPVDIIISRCNSWTQVLEEFDFNLNQFYFPSSIPKYSGQYNRDPGEFSAYAYNPSLTADDAEYFPVELWGAGNYTDLLGLRTCRPDASLNRRQYMLAKHEALTPQLHAYVWRKIDERGQSEAEG